MSHRSPKRGASASATTGSSSAGLHHRNLIFEGSVPLQVTIDAAELPAGSDRSIESFYIQAPRNSYLPLLLPDIRRHLIDNVLDEGAAAVLSDDLLWFESHGEPWRWHWPIGLLFDYHTAHLPPSKGKSTSTRVAASEVPLKLTLHLHSPPADKLLIGPSIDACRTNFMNMVKEADFVRWGSTRRVTALRKVDQDALWDGVVEHHFEKYWGVASKLVPAPAPPGSVPPPSVMGAPSSLTTDGRLPDANAVRSVPLRLYLPDGAPVTQDVVPPLNSSGRPVMLYDVLSAQVPLLFPPRAADMTASFLMSRPLARVISHGVYVPLDAEVGWLGSIFAGADGWVALVLSAIA